jgi:cell division septation protein DedD
MFDTTETTQLERSPAARHLVLVFLASVAVCAVFFSLGYLVGYNEKASKPGMMTENVSEPATIPPVVITPGVAQVASSSSSSLPTMPPAESNSSPVLQTVARPAPLPAAHPRTRAATASKTRAGARKSSSRALNANPEPKEEAAASNGAGYSVQVMASRTQADAGSLVKLLKGRGFPAFVLSAQAIGTRDNLYRVLVGPYLTRSQAEAVLKKLQKEGFQPFIKH